MCAIWIVSSFAMLRARKQGCRAGPRYICFHSRRFARRLVGKDISDKPGNLIQEGQDDEGDEDIEDGVSIGDLPWEFGGENAEAVLPFF